MWTHTFAPLLISHGVSDSGGAIRRWGTLSGKSKSGDCDLFLLCNRSLFFDGKIYLKEERFYVLW